MHLSCFPPTVPSMVARFPPQGSHGRKFPWFAGTIRRCDSWPPISPHSVSFARQYRECVRCFAPGITRTRCRTWSWSPGTPPGILVAAVRSLTFLGNPNALLLWSWTPAEPKDQALQSINAAPAQAKAKASRNCRFRGCVPGFSAGCLRFAVQGRPCPTQDSLPAVASSTGRD
jgi:hypothetical protein